VLAWSDIDWGNAPSWLAVTAASVAAGLTAQNVRVDVQDRRQRQAELVAAWWGVTEDARRLGMPWSESGAWLRNASSLPVYDVDVIWTLGDVLWRVHALRALPPTDKPMFVRLPPADQFERDLGLVGPPAQVDQDGNVAQSPEHALDCT
jgi:hypothetical protein